MNCPVWCKREREHEIHFGPIRKASNVAIRVAQDQSWDKPQIYLGYDLPGGARADVMLPLSEAEDMAALMMALGHDDIANLIWNEAIRAA